MSTPPSQNSVSLTVYATGFVALVLLCVWLAAQAASHPAWQSTVAAAGYMGIFVAGFVGGLNFLIPIPPATLTPLFISSGFSPLEITIILAAGTLAADFVGYLFGSYSRTAIAQRYPRSYKTFSRIGSTYRWYLLPVVTLYAAFVPFPNEAILIPLAVSGISFRLLLPALVVGNILHQAMLVFGVVGLNSLFL